jgi:hypothetical protein
MNKAEETKLNDAGDRLANLLGMKVDRDASPDSDGRTRWITSVGNKTGLGLFLTLERFISQEVVMSGKTLPRRCPTANGAEF